MTREWRHILRLVSIGSILLFSISDRSYAKPNINSLEELKNAMKCSAVYSPERVLKDLQRGGYIAEKPFVDVDGILVFETKKHIYINGLKIIFVEGWDSSNFFERAPGTGNPSYIGITVKGSASVVNHAFPPSVLTNPDFPVDRFPRLQVDDDITGYLYSKRPNLQLVSCLFSYD